MTTYFYLDTSDWVKRYIDEEGKRVIDAAWPVLASSTACSVLGHVELIAALSRRLRGGATQILRDQIACDFEGFIAIDLDSKILASAIALAVEHRLRGADAIHLASALSLRSQNTSAEVIMISCDAELKKAAETCCMVFVDPTRVDKIV